MKKTILFISSMDTKQEEIGLAVEIAHKNGCDTLILDTSTKTVIPGAGDISPVEVLGYSKITWDEFETMDKGARIETMAKAVVSYAQELYRQKRFDGVMSIGGGQNSQMSAAAMKELPYGVPKLIVSTLASGKRIFDTYVGNKDILVMHSVIDIAGVNSITKMIINNAVSVMVGMVEYGITLPAVKEKKRVAATMLGITTKGAVAVMDEMEKMGCETIGFHANGVGGGSMEKLMDEDYFDLILDMNLHEITCEFLGGFCTGAYQRLLKGAKKGIPQIIVPGAIDVLDFGVTLETRESVMEAVKDRQYYFHNAGIIHSKIKKEEAEKLGQVVAGRLNQATGPIELIIPLKGFCEAGARGKALYNKEVDDTFITVLKENLNSSVHVIEVEANINDQAFADVVIEEAKKMIA
ncbi:MAG: Tm-1-like ATP-binding domain-containing protein [Lachnospiraceae bacterium]